MHSEELSQGCLSDNFGPQTCPKDASDSSAQPVFPVQGESWSVLRERLNLMRQFDVDWRRGRAPLHIYYPGEEAGKVIREAYTAFMSENALSSAAFPSVDRMEREIVRAAVELFHGPAMTAGSVTSGGTESIMLAVKAAREQAKSGRLQKFTRGEILLPSSAHPAFDKAADLMELDVVRVPIGSDYGADLRVIEDAISDRTILLVGSAPSLPFGRVDPIEEMAELALRHDLWLHVDACIGGYIAPFAMKLGYSIPRFDFSIRGVRSISADLHKFGYAAKGASTILYRTPSDHNLQSFQFSNWPKGTYNTFTLLGTRSGSAIAAAWAIIHHLGQTGYLSLTERVMRLRDRFIEGVVNIDGLKLIAAPHLSVVAFNSGSCDIVAIGDQLASRGWYISRIAEPAGIHQTINLIHEPVIDDYLADLRAAVNEVTQQAMVGQRSEVYTY
jgi:sphinganine-1-phosphate aldolase